MQEYSCSNGIRTFTTEFKVTPYLRKLIAGYSLQRPGFESRLVHVVFIVVEKVAMGRVVLRQYLSTKCSILIHSSMKEDMQ